jgi:hypothetical protein
MGHQHERQNTSPNFGQAHRVRVAPANLLRHQGDFFGFLAWPSAPIVCLRLNGPLNSCKITCELAMLCYIVRGKATAATEAQYSVGISSIVQTVAISLVASGLRIHGI